jgi:hypothetical protein
MYKLVRLKPYNPRRGYLCRRFTFESKRFDGDLGWYEVPAAVAVELAKFSQSHDPGISLFDVLDPSEMLRAEAEEKAEEEAGKVKAPRRIEATEFRGGKDAAPEAAPAPAPEEMLDPAADGDPEPEVEQPKPVQPAKPSKPKPAKRGRPSKRK